MKSRLRIKEEMLSEAGQILRKKLMAFAEKHGAMQGPKPGAEMHAEEAGEVERHDNDSLTEEDLERLKELLKD